MPGRNWVFALTGSGSRMESAGHHLERLIAAQDALGELGPDSVLALADDHRLDRSVRLGGGVGVLERAFLRLDGGLGTRIELDPEMLEVVASLDGRPLGEFPAGSLPGLRRLFELGFLVRA